MNTTVPATAGKLAILAALAACMSTSLGGSAFVAIRFLVTETEPVTIAFLRNFTAAVILTAIALVIVRRWPNPRAFLMMALMGALFFGGLQLIFSNALAFTTSSRGALAYTTSPFMTLLIAAMFGIERATRQKLAGIVLATAGVVVALGQSAGAPPDAWIGDGLILVGALITAVYGVWSNRALRDQSPLVAVVAGVVPGSAMLYAVAMATDAPAFTPELSRTGWFAIAYLGIGAAVISYTLWLWALRNTTPTLVAVALPMNPLMALFWGAVLLDERITVTMLAGFALVIAGIAVTNWQRRPKPVPA
ncbi:MAG: DMT family transporter [Alphaproteobacteria bacterium]|nr:DMT family transporter [Alphaproteobacteria bacterium]